MFNTQMPSGHVYTTICTVYPFSFSGESGLVYFNPSFTEFLTLNRNSAQREQTQRSIRLVGPMSGILGTLYYNVKVDSYFGL